MAETNTESSTRWGDLIELQPQQIVQIAFLGAGLGILTWLLAAIIKQAILIPLFCGDPTSGLCVNASESAGNVAVVIAGIAALLGLVRLSVYRPLLIAIAAVISLWGFGGWVSGLPWFEGIAWAVLLHTVAYTLFAWIVRLRSFVTTIAIVIVTILIVRVLPML